MAGSVREDLPRGAASSGGCSLEPASVRRLVVVQLYFLGDTLLATPALRALRRRFPGAALEVVVKRRSAAALERNPNVDRVTHYDPPRVWQRPFHWAALARGWRDGGVDLAVDLTADGRAERLLAGMRPAHSVGFHREGRIAARPGIPKACGPEHVSRHMLELVGLVGATGDARLEFHPSPGAREAARAWRGGLRGPVVALHPGGNRKLRRWRPDRFAALARGLAAGGAHVWVIGGRGERALGALLAREGAEDASGRLDLDAAAARLEESDLLVANDSGPMHLAAAVGTPVLALFGPSLPHTAAPLGPQHAHLHVRLECCPCDQRRCVRPNDFCLDRIPVEQALERAREMLGASVEGTP
ncbi:MAG: glycosyltransferase family 9 protein [Candidatus Eisenbacteria bacterium]|nr:glycosyltransferase family 9 protein [Candidatus Eisenbacteria bacterium]